MGCYLLRLITRMLFRHSIRFVVNIACVASAVSPVTTNKTIITALAKRNHR